MVRTAGSGIRISSGKSSKKTGGGGVPAESSGTSSKSKGGNTSLPPIPFQETPSWQKPITTFFKNPSKLKENYSEQTDKNEINNVGSSRKKLKRNHLTEQEDNNAEEKVEKNKEDRLKNGREFNDGAGSSKDTK